MDSVIDQFQQDSDLGTAADDARYMQLNGRKQELNRIYGLWGLSAFGSAIIVSWEVILGTPSSTGTAVIVFGLFYASAGFWTVYASLAELASMYPTSGGQYEWISKLAPSGFERLLSYSIGWLNFLGWLGGITGISLLFTSVLTDFILLWSPTFTGALWKSTLITIAVIWLCVGFNVFSSKRLPAVEIIVILVHVFGAFVVAVPLLTMGRIASPQDALLGLPEEGGWASQGFAYILSTNVMYFAFVGFDSQVHVAEETRNAAKTLPRAILVALGANQILALPVVFTVAFAFGPALANVNDRFNTSFMGVFLAISGRRWATAMVISICIPLLGSVLACVATASRQLWAFSRDEGVPFAHWLMQIHPGLKVPRNALLGAGLITTILASINFGSNVALNAVLSVGTSSIVLSYAMCIGLLTWSRLRGKLEPGPWTLGRAGAPINCIAFLFLAFVFVLLQFPGDTEPSAADFNWSIVIVSIVLIFAGLWWVLRARKQYVSPKEREKMSGNIRLGPVTRTNATASSGLQQRAPEPQKTASYDEGFE